MYEIYKKRLGWLKGQKHHAIITTASGLKLTGLVRKFDDECVTLMKSADAGTDDDILVRLASIEVIQTRLGDQNV